ANAHNAPDKGNGIGSGSLAAKDFRLNQAGKCQGEPRPPPEPRQYEPESLAKNETIDAFLLRAERHADADFPRALARAVSHDAIDANGGEQHGQKTERAGKRSRDASKKSAELHCDGKRIHVEQRQLRIELMDRLFHSSSHGTRT